MLCKTKHESITFVTYSISLSSLFIRQRQRPFNNPNSLSTITLALDKDLLNFFCVSVRRILLGYGLTNHVFDDKLLLLKVMILQVMVISSIIFSGRVSTSLVSHFWYNVVARNILASCTLPGKLVETSENIRFEPTTACKFMVYFCFLQKLSSLLSDEGAKISICVPSTAATTWGIEQSVNSWNDVVASAVSNAVTGNLINVGASWTMWFIPSWDILITIDFSTPKSLLTNLYEFRVESLHITMANLFSTLIAS